MFKLKADVDFPHHYIIGVAIRDMRSKDRGKMFMKYGPLYFTNDDIQKVSNAVVLLDDKIYRNIYKMTPDEIYKSTECNELIISLYGLKIASQANAATLHHFSSPFKLDDAENFFNGYVERANLCKTERKKLDDALIRA